MKIYLIYIFIISLCVCQLDSLRLDEFLLVTNNGDRISGTEGILRPKSFNGLDSKKETFQVNVDEIKSLYQYKKSKAFVMGALGGVAGAVFGVSLSYNNDNVSSSVIPISAGIGVVIGALIGSTQEEWKKIEFEN